MLTIIMKISIMKNYNEIMKIICIYHTARDNYSIKGPNHIHH